MRPERANNWPISVKVYDDDDGDDDGERTLKSCDRECIIFRFLWLL